MSAMVLALIGWMATPGMTRSIDSEIGERVRQFASPNLTVAMKLVTRLGSTLVLLVLGLGAVAVLLYQRRLKAIGVFLLSMIGQAILHHGFKWIVGRERPEAILNYVVDDSPSFPSGHALASTAFYFTLAYLFLSGNVKTPTRIGVWVFTVLLVLTICASRVYFNVHYPTDVLAGFVAAAIWTYAVTTVPSV
jgi:undecaprenyl-diphosphatase